MARSICPAATPRALAKPRRRALVRLLVSAALLAGCASPGPRAEGGGAAILSVADTVGPYVYLAVELTSDWVLVRDLADGAGTKRRSDLSALERYRLERFLRSPEMEQARAGFASLGAPGATDGHVVAFEFGGARFGYEVGCQPPAGRARELVSLLNEIFASHFGQDATIALVESACEPPAAR
ncbi:MAG: hypothetical protein U0X73_17420 [Thermoanaerobaculia bacterium]